MEERNYYVLSWNSEYLSQAILAGPASFEEAGEVLREEAIKRIGELGLDDEHGTFPEHLYELAADEITAEEVDSVDASQWGACLYFDGQEERISIVQYDLPDNLQKGRQSAFSSILSEYNEEEVLAYLREEAKEKGYFTTLVNLVNDHEISIEKAAARAKVSVSEFVEKAKQYDRPVLETCMR